MPIGNFPESLSQAILVGITLVGTLAVGLSTWPGEGAPFKRGGGYCGLRYCGFELLDRALFV